MRIEIKHRHTNDVLFACEAENMREVVVNAVKSEAYLSEAYLLGANLSGAGLSGADLSGADLSGADLSCADLSGADLSGEILAIAPISILNLTWNILISEQYLKIGCKRHTHDEWKAFGDAKIKSMESRASDFWNANKVWILAACDAHKAESLKARETK